MQTHTHTHTQIKKDFITHLSMHKGKIMSILHKPTLPKSSYTPRIEQYTASMVHP